MRLEVNEVKNKEAWEQFLLECEEKTFLQSWNWGEFNKMMGNKIWRLGLFENREGLSSIALVVKVRAKRGTFLFLPHGPSVTTGSNIAVKFKVLKIFLDKLKEISKDEKVSFIRIAPIWEGNKENIDIFKRLGFKEAPIHIHPELTWELNVTPSEEELLMKMRKTTRYLIRQGLKNSDLAIEKSSRIEDLKDFNKLYLEVAYRHHFVPFSLNYLKNEFLAFLPDNQISLFLGKYKGEILAGGIFVFWQKIGFYHHGATSLKYPKIPVSYLLLWEAIKEAKKRSCHFFNFWGIAPENRRFHPWAGLTLFKKGFGGYKKEYVKTQDFPLSKKYWLTFLFEKIRRKKRGL